MSIASGLVPVRLRCIAETISTRPVLGHWPAMQARVDADTVNQAAKEIEWLRERIIELSRCDETVTELNENRNRLRTALEYIRDHCNGTEANGVARSALKNYSHERDCGLTGSTGICECPQPSEPKR